MATEAQIRANQSNARKSTGPRTPEGKARSAQNGRIHGLCAQTMILTSLEEREDFMGRIDEISKQYRFEHALKQTLVYAIASAEHQIHFINRIKRGVVANLCETVPTYTDSDPYVAVTRLLSEAFFRDLSRNDVLTKLNRYEVEQHRILYRAVTTLEALYDRYRESAPAVDEANPIPAAPLENKRSEPPPIGSAPPAEANAARGAASHKPKIGLPRPKAA